MNTDETPQLQTSISQMTPLPGESVQTSPDLLSFLLLQWEKKLKADDLQKRLSPLTPQILEAVKLLSDFSNTYFKENPPIQSTTVDGRAVITLGDNQKVQIGGEPTEEFEPGSIVSSTAIKI